MGISFDFRSEDYGELQHLVDALFAPGVSRYATVTKLDVLMPAEASGHGWGGVYGTVE